MNNAKLALAVGAGYLLGRLRKGRWALSLASFAAGKRLKADPGALLGELFESTPQLREMTQAVGGSLAAAGREALVAAAGHQMETVTNRLREGTSGSGRGRDPEHADRGRADRKEGPRSSTSRGDGQRGTARSASRTRTKPATRTAAKTSGRTASKAASKAAGTRRETARRNG